jgi:hypothetical protein
VRGSWCTNRPSARQWAFISSHGRGDFPKKADAHVETESGATPTIVVAILVVVVSTIIVSGSLRKSWWPMAQTWQPRQRAPVRVVVARSVFRHGHGPGNDRTCCGKTRALLPGLIANAGRLVATRARPFCCSPVGLLVHATCSLLKRESEDQVARLLHERPDDVEMVPFTPNEIPGVVGPQILAEGYIRIVPTPLLDVTGAAELGGDGFFVARLRKRTGGVYS